jgi:hypothetical protein
MKRNSFELWTHVGALLLLSMNDTAITALYIGPDIRLTWGTSLAANLAIDLPVLQHNTALQIVPDFRLRGGLTWRF